MRMSGGLTARPRVTASIAGTPSEMTESAVIAPVGELDLDSVRALAPQLDEAVAADYPRLILDL